METAQSSALNFSYLLLDYYKDLNINENELAVLLMIHHLLKQDNDFITSDELLKKMNLSSEEIDKALTSLYSKKYIEYLVNNGKMKTSIKPIKKILYKKFEESIFSEQELEASKEKRELRDKVFSKIEEYFARPLTPLEINRIDEWINSKIDEDIIMSSIEDARKFNDLSVTKIDRLIINKLKVSEKNE